MEVSQADLIRQHIVAKLASGADYKNRSEKRADIQDFIKSHPELKGTEKNISDHFGKILKSIAKENKIPPKEVGIRPRMPKVNPSMIQQNSDMDISIEPRPQSTPLVGAPQVQQPLLAGQQQPQVPQANPAPKGNHDEKAVSAALTAFYIVLKTGFAPLADELSDEEKDSLGKLGKPVFDRFFGENEDLIVCFLGIGGVFVPKLAKGRKLKKEQQVKEEEKKKLEEQTDGQKTNV